MHKRLIGFLLTVCLCSFTLGEETLRKGHEEKTSSRHEIYEEANFDPRFEAWEGGSEAAEAELRSKVVDKFRLIQAGIQRQTGKMMRDTHSVGACLSGKFQFYDRKEDFLRVGSFGTARSIDVSNIRFADANSGVQSNKVPDVRSVSFSIDLGGQRQDFSMNNDPTFTFGSQNDFNNFLAFSIMQKQIQAEAEAEFRAVENEKVRSAKIKLKVTTELLKFLSANSRVKEKLVAVKELLFNTSPNLEDALKTIGGVKRILMAPSENNDMVGSVLKTILLGKLQQNKDVFSYVTENYGSGSAFKFGKDQAAKFHLVRCEKNKDTTQGLSSCYVPEPVRQKMDPQAPNDVLVERLKQTVNDHSEDFCFELKVQLLDTEKMRDQFNRKHAAQKWVEDPTLRWDGTDCYSLGKLTAKPNSMKRGEECDDPKNAFDVNTHRHADLRPLGNINRARKYAEHQSAALRSLPAIQPVKPIPVTRTKGSDQGWDYSIQDSFWYTPQGSYIIPYKWFLALKDNKSGKPLIETLEDDGFLPGAKSELNPDGLPIGITKESEPSGNFPQLKGKGDWVGITCAACHTGSINVNGVRHIIEGAPGKIDLQSFSLKIEDGLKAALADEKSFAQFKKNVGSEVTREQVEEVLRRFEDRNTRSFFHEANRNKGLVNAGPGRADAFGIILNEVGSRAVGAESNEKEATAPVSYPKLWGAPFLKWIQYSALSNNAFTRNIGEVLGVFGDVNLDPHSPDFLSSTTRLENIQKLEEHMRSLKPPRWERVFGEFTSEEKRQIERGKRIFHEVANCAQCHSEEKNYKLGSLDDVALLPAGEFERDYTRNEQYAGTDAFYFLKLKKDWQAVNPGVLKGTNVFRAMLKHDPTLLDRLRFADDKEVNGKIERGRMGSQFIQSLRNERLFDEKTNAVQLLAQTTLAIGLKYMADNKIVIDQNDPTYQRLTGGAIPGIQPKVGNFKAIPLSGIWATGPYLHNGSVRTLRDMLEPPASREPAFYVGGSDYDQKNGGFASSGPYLFFANKMGDTNSGHYAFSGAAALSDSEKADLLMYLKSL